MKRSTKLQYSEQCCYASLNSVCCKYGCWLPTFIIRPARLKLRFLSVRCRGRSCEGVICLEAADWAIKPFEERRKALYHTDSRHLKYASSLKRLTRGKLKEWIMHREKRNSFRTSWKDCAFANGLPRFELWHAAAAAAAGISNTMDVGRAAVKSGGVRKRGPVAMHDDGWWTGWLRRTGLLRERWQNYISLNVVPTLQANIVSFD